MVCAMNLYDIKPDKAEEYRKYLAEATLVTDHLSDTGKIIATGHNPSKNIKGKSLSHFIIVEFSSSEAFEQIISILDKNQISELREDATENYIWTLFEPWDIAQWIVS